jgi:hypothetical protein
LTQGDIEFVQVLSSMIVSTATVAAIVVVDERRLGAGARARAWPRASRDAAIFGAWLFGALFGCLLIFVHFARTRGLLVGLGLGLLWAAFLLAADLGTASVVGAVADWLRH